jgi:hypothetical protein
MQYGGFTSFALFNPKTLLNGGLDKNVTVVPVNMTVVRFLDFYRRRSVTVAAMLNFARAWIQPWHIEWKMRKDKKSRTFANQNDDAFIASQFEDLPQNALCDFLSFGFCVERTVRIANLAPGEDTPANYRPEIMEPDTYEIMLEYNRSTGARHYRAYHTKGSSLAKVEIKNSIVHIFRHPNPVTGVINSPLATAYETLMALENSLTLTMVSQDRMAFPLTYYNKTAGDMVMRDQQLQTDHAGAVDRSLFDSAEQFKLQQMQIAKLNLHQVSNQILDSNIESAELAANLSQQADYRNPTLASTRDTFLQISRQHPHLPTLPLPLNIGITNAPDSRPLPDYLAFQDRLREEIAQAFGIPAAVVFGGSNKFAADVAFTKLQLGQVLKEWEHSLSHMLIRTYMKIYYNQIASDLLGGIDTKLDDAVKKEKRSAKEPNKARRIKLLLSEKLYQEICQELQFSIFFEKITLLDPAYVRELYNTEVIDYVTYCKLMLGVGNIAQSNRNQKGKPPPTEREQIELQQEAKRQKLSAGSDEGVAGTLTKKLKDSETQLDKDSRL